MSAEIRTGLGFDAHPFTADRPLLLCGVAIPDSDGLAGNSDADAALHALMDGLLGCCALGDIGDLFPPDDPAYRDASSRDLLEQCLRKIHQERPALRIISIDLTIIGKRPVMKPHREAMRASLAELLSLEIDRVSVKFASGNGLGFAGRGEGLTALAMVTAQC